MTPSTRHILMPEYTTSLGSAKCPFQRTAPRPSASQPLADRCSLALTGPDWPWLALTAQTRG